MKLHSSIFLMLLALTICVGSRLTASGSEGPSPVTARDLYNAGTKFLAATNYIEAEKMFRAALLKQDESVQAQAEFNLAHTRFADGAAILKKGPDAQKISERSQAALAAGNDALRAGESSLAESNMEKMVAAYMNGLGARREVRAAEKAVKAAMEIYGKTLMKWQRAADDFSAAAELNPADTNAAANAKSVQKGIAALVDQLQMWQQMAAQLAGQKQQLGKMLSQLKGKVPAPNAPPGSGGDDEEDDKGENGNQGDIKPESLSGKEENAGREGTPIESRLSPDQANQMLDGLPVDGNKRLPMGGGKESPPPKDKKGRNW